MAPPTLLGAAHAPADTGGASSCGGRPTDAETAADAALAGARVLLISHGFQPNYERGFANGLAANGAQVVLIASDRSEFAALAPAVATLNLRGSQDSRRPALHKALNLLRYHLRLLVVVLRRRGHVAHVTGLLVPLLWCGLVEGLWLRAVARRYVLTIHNLVPHGSDGRISRALHALAYRLPDALVVHTAAMKQQLVERFGLPARRIHVMQHGIEPFGPGETAALPAPRTDGPLQLLFFGALLPYKGLDLLLQALAGDVPDFELHIAGPCVDAELDRHFDRLIASHPARCSIVRTRGFIAEADVPALFMRADALVLPYRHIDQSGVLFQALRYGLPVIASDVGSLRDYVDPQIGEICAPGDAAALAAALRRFAARRGTLSRQHIRDHGRRFEWPLVTRALAAAYALDPPAGSSAPRHADG
jgi:glycosyltransferase involved in cell wall biosynthesis